ncbi:MAG: hypothetical protein KDD62_12120, partial [Bdellovibrionales bacterium]|nr:hypothetical protein [Bdellovibrionales bacterium]
HSISRTQIDQDALKIMRRLIRFGHKGYLVGGGVRDLLLGKEPKDFDIATDATPRKIKSLFRNCRIIGKRFKLAHVYFRGMKIIEVATFRKQTTDDSDDPETETVTLGKDNTFGDEQNDALRRDLTINGLFYDLDTFTVIDYVGGVEDLRNGIVRMIGDPMTRYTEDPVRMLRVARHAGRTGFTIEAATGAAIEKCLPLLADVAPVRIYEEVKKDMTSGHFREIAALFDSLGLLSTLLPRWSDLEVKPWDRHSPFYPDIEELDCSFQEHETDQVNLTLSALCVWYARIKFEQEFFSHVIEQKDDVPAFVNEVFEGLLVPRKEKERIQDILRALQVFEQKGPNAIQGQHIRSKANVQSLVALLQVLNHPEFDDEARNILNNLSIKRKKRGRPQKRFMRKPGGNF